MDIQYKPSKPKKEKPIKAEKSSKASKPMNFGSAQSVKIDEPKKVKEPKVKVPKAEKAKPMSFGKIQSDKPMKMDKAQKPSFLSKLDPKLVLGGVLVLIVAVSAIMLTVVIPAVEEQGMQIQKIEITHQPDKLVYLVGEEADYDGLRVTITRKNGETFEVRATKCEITGFSSKSAATNQIVTVGYEGCYDTFKIQVVAVEKPKAALIGIHLDPMPKTEYQVGEWLDTTGAYIICEYADGSTDRVALRNTDVYGFTKVTGPGTYKLTVQYSENGRLAEYTYTITVTE